MFSVNELLSLDEFLQILWLIWTDTNLYFQKRFGKYVLTEKTLKSMLNIKK